MIEHYIREAVSYAVLFFLAYFVIRYVYLKKKNQKMNLFVECRQGFFGAYIFALLSQTIFPLWHWGYVNGEFYIQIRKYGNGDINLIPFQTISHFLFDTEYMQNWEDVSELNLLANIGLFIPFGFLLPFVSRNRTLRRTLKCGVLLSLFIEIMQYFVGRSSDVDDLILNMFGVGIGWLFFWLVEEFLVSNK